ncbi:MAG: translational GTPase TypA [Candidatus Promineifilaceae bacterium]
MSRETREDIRNIAIIAHVDHGKTTLVDGMLRGTNVFRSNQVVEERVLDDNPLERERGITILAKNTGIRYMDTTINIVDTPGHADFGGEVERVLNMVDGALLLVDAAEGPMPQTRFVLRQALQRGIKIILVVNKIDRLASRPDEVVNATFDLFIELGAAEDQADFPVIYTQALNGQAGFEPDALAPDLSPLFETIIDYLPGPSVDPDGMTQMLVTTLEYSDYVGRIAVGRLTSGEMRAGQSIMHISASGEMEPAKITKLYSFQNLRRVEQEQIRAGDIVAVAGVPTVGIGDTLADKDQPRALPPITVEEPTVRMAFQVNNSPFAGREGKYVTSRQLRARLMRELESNVALRVEDTERAGEFIVSGRGELHLAIVIETMRREGYELSVGRPEVIFKETESGRQEPIEDVFLEVHADFLGAVTEMLGKRRGELLQIRYGEDGTVYSEYRVPTRGMLGFRQPFLTATRGTGIYHTLFHAYQPYRGDIEIQETGSLVSLETGVVSAYALIHLMQRGTLFISPGEQVYGGQVVGQHIRGEDLVINVCKTKNLTGHRAVPRGIAESLPNPREMSLDERLEYLGPDDLLEVTPESLRIRKSELRHDIRKKQIMKSKNGAIPNAV